MDIYIKEQQSNLDETPILEDNTIKNDDENINEDNNNDKYDININNISEIQSLNIETNNFVRPEKNIDLLNNILQIRISLDQEIKDMETELKIKKKKLTELSKILLNYMKIHDVREIKLNEHTTGTIIKPTEYTISSLNKDTIIATLQEYFIDNIEEFEKIMALISSKAKIKTTTKLNFKKPKTQRNKNQEQLNKVSELLDDPEL
jgi:hypothetical protein